MCDAISFNGFSFTFNPMSDLSKVKRCQGKMCSNCYSKQGEAEISADKRGFNLSYFSAGTITHWNFRGFEILAYSLTRAMTVFPSINTPLSKVTASMSNNYANPCTDL